MTIQKLPEMFEVYDLDGNLLCTQERKKFYSDIRLEHYLQGKISKQVKSVRAILMNTSGKIYCRKRSRDRSDNPGMYDKTVGKYVPLGMNYDSTLVKECSESMGFPAVIASDDEMFRSDLLSFDLRTIAVFKPVELISPYESVRLTKRAEEFRQPFMNMFYIGYFDGGLRFSNGEFCGIESFALPELQEQMANSPKCFTQDLSFMVRRYSSHLKPVKDNVNGQSESDAN